MTKLNSPPAPSRIPFPVLHAHIDIRQRALDRLYERKATVEALIESLEAYARCRVPAEVTAFPLRGN